MRTFKIIVVTALLLVGAGILLLQIKERITRPLGSGGMPESYNEDREESDEKDLYQRELKLWEGTVKVLGISIYQQGTHRLEKNDRLVGLLQSSTHKLDEYLEKEVIIKGFVRDTVEGGQKIMDVVFLQVLTESGVKRFQEVGYEFQFSYPAEWELKKDQDQATFLRKSETGQKPVMIVYQYPGESQSLNLFLKDRDQNLQFQESTITVGGLSGIRRMVSTGVAQIIKSYVKNGSIIYELRLVDADEISKNQYYSIVDYFKMSFSDEVSYEEVEELLPKTSPNEATTSQPEEPKAPTDNSSEPPPTFTTLPPLSSDDVQKILTRGFNPFQGRAISFDYPKSWYFSYLGNGIYGMTDDKTYKEKGEITEEWSRILIFNTTNTLSCSEKRESGDYTVCSKEPGLGSLLEKIAQSLRAL